MPDGAPTFPPLLRGRAAGDPFAAALEAARTGTDAGLITYAADDRGLDAALVLAPEVPLAQAMAMVLAVAHGVGDAIGALAPPEVALQFRWPGTFLLNGAVCGDLRAAAASDDPAVEPDWLVVGIRIGFVPPSDADPGHDPDRTTLWAEGCTDITPLGLLESWSRHTLVWVNTWDSDGTARLITDWTGRAFDFGKEVTVDLPSGRRTGTALGLDEAGGLLLKEASGTALIPLTEMLEPC